MKTYVSLFVLATLLSFSLTPLTRTLARRWGVVDEPDPERRIHQQPIPRLGGVAIFFAFIVTLAVIPLLNNLVSAQWRISSGQVLKLLVPCTVIFLLGVYDDFRGANARIKFTVQILASILLYSLGLRITYLWNPFGGVVELGLLALPLTTLWLVGITNAFNLIDGLDGLSAGAALFATVTVMVVGLIHGHPLIVIMSIALAGATLGFLRYNFAPATVFMGDSGSLFLGFAIAALALEGSQKSTTAVAVAIPIVSLGLPILDTGWALARRVIGKKPLFTGDREHIHHMILKQGLSSRQAIALLYGVCALFALFSLLFLNPNGQVMGLVLFIVGVCVFIGIQRLGYHEVTELRYALGKLFGQRHVLAANINVRRAARNISEAGDLQSLFGELHQMLAGNDFDRVDLRLLPAFPGEETPSPRPSPASIGPSSQIRTEDERLVWSWGRAGLVESEPLDALHCWRLVVPLATGEGLGLGEITFYRGLDRTPSQLDILHLCTCLQQELSRTLERIQAARWHSEAPAVKTHAAASGRSVGSRL